MIALAIAIVFFVIYLLVAALLTDEPKELPRETNLRDEFYKKNNIKRR